MRAVFPTAETTDAGEDGGSRVGYVGHIGGFGRCVGWDICYCVGAAIVWNVW